MSRPRNDENRVERQATTCVFRQSEPRLACDRPGSDVATRGDRHKMTSPGEIPSRRLRCFAPLRDRNDRLPWTDMVCKLAWRDAPNSWETPEPAYGFDNPLRLKYPGRQRIVAVGEELGCEPLPRLEIWSPRRRSIIYYLHGPFSPLCNRPVIVLLPEHLTCLAILGFGSRAFGLDFSTSALKRLRGVAAHRR